MKYGKFIKVWEEQPIITKLPISNEYLKKERVN